MKITKQYIINYIELLIPIVLIGLVVYFFQIENDLNLPKAIPFIIGGFIIHNFLPSSFRVSFFLLLSFTTLVLLVGWWSSFWIIGIGIGIVAVSAIQQLNYRYRLLIIGLIGIGLLGLRVGNIELREASTISRFVGVLFMFRILVYGYELQYEKDNPSFLMRLSYFFLLPNLIFPIFPVVDYKTFKRSHYTQPALAIYKKGMLWMARGVFHLLLYRLIYYYLLPSPTEITTLFQLFYYLILAYALTLRLSGLFHFSAGVLCLFGFDLPKTFDKHFLASGFNDLFRRINIYWRDFLMKVFYYPIYFKIKQYGILFSLIVTLGIVFIINLLLHSYQWFWIRGDFRITKPDVIFWGIFGVLVTIDTVIQFKKNTKKRRKLGGGIWQKAFYKSSKIIGMFVLMSVMWSLWISPTLDYWIELMKIITFATLTEWLLLFLLLISTIGLGMILQYLVAIYPKIATFPWAYNSKTVSIAFLGIIFFAFPPINQFINQQLSFDTTSFLISKLNKFDEEQLFEGYYEDLLTSSNINSRIGELQSKKPKDWQQLNTTGIVEEVKEHHYRTLKPNQSIYHKGVTIKTNQFGLRDKDYTLEKSPKVYRIALLGGSIDMGMGVENDETYENLVEESLNQNGLLVEYDSVEILNFSISRAKCFEYIGNLEHNVLQFDPDMIWFAEQYYGVTNMAIDLTKLVYSQKEMPLPPFIKKVIKEMPSDALRSKSTIRGYFEERKFELFEHFYQEIKEICDKNKIETTILYIESLTEPQIKEQTERTLKIAKTLNYQIIDLSTVFNSIEDRKILQLGEWDKKHPNKLGHKIIGKEICKQFLKLSL